jgi:diketogulonate reductase-like aldo/keto reductase
MSLPSTFPIRVAGGTTAQIPSVGFGTWAFEGGPTDPANPEWIKKALKTAFDAGYRHLECAWFYGVDQEIGEAIREHGISRSDIFINSKIWPNFYHPDYVEACCDKILEGMQLDYIDCLLLHWPCAFKPTSLEALKDASAQNQAPMEKKAMALTDDGGLVIDWKWTSEPIARAGGHPEGSIVPTWKAMEKLVEKGKARAIGVSNFDIADLKALLPHTTIPISVNQVEAHPWFPNQELVDFANQNGILTSCFSPFAGQKADGATLIHDPTVKQLAEKNNMGVGQLLQSWAVQRGTVPLGKSGNDGEWQLSPEFPAY